MNCCREITKMGVPPGRRLRDAEYGLRICGEVGERLRENGEIRIVTFDIIYCSQKSEIRNPKSNPRRT
jgi:hypothetical protein